MCGPGKSFSGDKIFILPDCTPPSPAREFGSDDSLEFSLVTDSKKNDHVEHVVVDFVLDNTPLLQVVLEYLQLHTEFKLKCYR